MSRYNYALKIGITNGYISLHCGFLISNTGNSLWHVFITALVIIYASDTRRTLKFNAFDVYCVELFKDEKNV